MKKKQTLLSLGGESAGNFSIYFKDKIYFSSDFGDLLEEKNFQNYKNSLFSYLKKEKIKPKIIITDLHPFYKTTQLGKELTQKFKAKFFQVQHHLAHIFSVIGEKIIKKPQLKIKDCFGLASDGTGYGLDGRTWGGEIFKISFLTSKQKPKIKIQRVGHLENQTLIGGDLTIKEPARMLISILSKFKIKNQEQFIYKFIKKYYSKNQFKLLFSQLQQNFNCQETSSTARILDVVSVLLGFAKNQRNYKHEPVDLLEKNSTFPYFNFKPKLIIKSYQPLSYNLLTTPLFEYLVKNLHQDKKRLAATAQLYLAQGFFKIIEKLSKNQKPKIFFAGGLAKNKIISSYLKSKGVIFNKKFPPGDAGLSFGQISYYLLQNSNYFPSSFLRF